MDILGHGVDGKRWFVRCLRSTLVNCNHAGGLLLDATAARSHVITRLKG